MEIINPWVLYLWTRLDVFGIGFGLICTILLVLNVIWLPLSQDMDCREFYGFVKKYIKWTILLPVFGLLLCGLLPSKKDMAMIYVVPKLANSQVLQQEAGDIYKMAKTALQEYLPKVEEVTKP